MRIAIHDFGGHPFVFELSRQLAANGHDVRHFFFKDYPGPKGKTTDRVDDPSTMSVEAISVGGRYSLTNFPRRFVDNLRYGAAAARRIRAFQPDVILSGNTPLETQALLLISSKASRTPFIFWMQDFYSLAVKAILQGRWMGLGSLIGAFYGLLEKVELRASDGVVLITDGFRGELKKLGLDLPNAATIPNWGSIRDLPTRAKKNPWSVEGGIHDRFVFLYSGTLGLKHDAQLLIDLADEFASDDEVVVVAVCNGAGATALKEKVRLSPRPNLLILPLQPIEALPDMLGSADVTVSMIEADAGRFSVPSKTLSYLCAGRPILISAPFENLAAEIVRGADAGMTPAAGDRTAFLDAARQLRASAARRETMGENARRYAVETFDLASTAARFETLFSEVTSRRR